MKTLREYIDILDEISRRDFLKGAGAAAAGAAIGQAKGQTANFAEITRQAVSKAQNAISRFKAVQFAEHNRQLMSYVSQNVNRVILAYLMDTNGFNANDVINYATDFAFREADSVKLRPGDRMIGIMATDQTQTFVDSYVSAVTQKFNEYQSQVRSQSQRHPIFHKENDDLNMALTVYYFSKDFDKDIFQEIQRALTNYISSTGKKDLVNAGYKEIKQLLDQRKSSNPEQWENLRRSFLANNKKLIQKLEQQGPEFKESQELEESGPEDPIARIDRLFRNT
jgi:hypothetical protein